MRGEDYVLRVKVEEVLGDGPFVAKARGVVGEQLNVLLTRAGEARASSGSIVGIRAPTWEIEVDGSSWAVAVDWEVLT